MIEGHLLQLHSAPFPSYTPITVLNKGFVKLNQWLCTSRMYTFYLFCHDCRTWAFAVKSRSISHSLCRGDLLGAQALFTLKHLWHQLLSKRVSIESIQVPVLTVKFRNINFFQCLMKKRIEDPNGYEERELAV